MEKIINPTTARTNLFSLIKNANRDSQPVIIAGSNDSRSAVLIDEFTIEVQQVRK
ncbi:type II toxin-antitoxin system Phd/YefM family antitoxin (plasmid) [Lactiplantibacillus pentosus]|uniref:type II toxin-antitoxin system Phd/YefM family antitoxin n=1 Tax=Lactiplantibacillus pentosus TaxID=1589 RepID=UPI002091E519|nr:type II toxin-antitoxin system Phd/YefM family antitoxin [Lactiplantibacillus pentosus]WMB65071.1 type II toxin-antitoxin system Phd/YefM family antitoxin [Lactiplantibacillus pentosus]